MSLVAAINNSQSIAQAQFQQNRLNLHASKPAELQGIANPYAAGGASAINAPTGTSGVDFAQRLQGALETRATGAMERPTLGEMAKRGVDYVDAKQKVAGEEVRKLMTGESDNLHQAVIAGEEAGVAFNLMLETRNKMMTALQELMRLQV